MDIIDLVNLGDLSHISTLHPIDEAKLNRKTVVDYFILVR